MLHIFLEDKGFLFGFFLFFLLFVAARLFFSRDSSTGKSRYLQWQENQQPTFSDLQWPIRQLLKSGFNKATLVIRFTDFGFCVLFKKYIKEENRYGIQLIFQTSENCIANIRSFSEYCERNEVIFSVNNDPNDRSSEILSIDCGKDSDEALRLLRVAVQEIWKIPENGKHEYELSGLAGGGQLVESPDQEILPPQEVRRAKKEAFIKFFGVSPLDVVLFVLTRTAGAVGYVGLAYSILVGLVVWALSINTVWNVFSFNIFDVYLTVKAFDIFCIFLIFTSFLQLFTSTYWAAKFRKEGRTWEDISKNRCRIDRNAMLHDFSFFITRRANILFLLTVITWFIFNI